MKRSALSDSERSKGLDNFSNPFFSKNLFFRALLSAPLKLNAEGALASQGTSIPAIQFYAANRLAFRLVAGMKSFQISCKYGKLTTLAYRNMYTLSAQRPRANTPHHLVTTSFGAVSRKVGLNDSWLDSTSREYQRRSRNTRFGTRQRHIIYKRGL